MATSKKVQPTGWVGWVYFAGILLIVRAIFEAFFGFVALTKNEILLVTPDQLAVFNFTTWGIIHLIVAVVLLTAGFSVLNGGMWGRIIGTFAAAMGVLVSLAFLPAYPLWCIAAIVIDILIMYALIVHGREAQA